MGKLAVVFPGQGSQVVGMLADAQSQVKTTFDEASSVLGYDLWELIQSGPEEKLNQTEFTQPALLAASIALWRLLKERGMPEPSVVAGHSLGEYSALVAANVIAFADAVSLVQKRGRYMQNAVPIDMGGMAAVLGLDDQKVVDLCKQACEQAPGEAVVQAANFNSPGQVVIAGESDILRRAMELCKEAGAKRVIPLSVSAPFHSALMQPAADQMKDALSYVSFAPPEFRIIQNVDAAYCDDPEMIKENLIKQMFSAVLWTATVQHFVASDIFHIVECGPGRVLSTLNRRIDRSITSSTINSLESLESLDSFFGDFQ